MIPMSLLTYRRMALTLSVLCLLMLLAPARALAHGSSHTGPTQTFTQAVGPYELTVMLELPSAIPASLHLALTPQHDIGTVQITMRAVPRGRSFDGAPAAEVQTAPGLQGLYFADLSVDRVGDWELEVRAEGEQGSGAARIPFTITEAPLPAYSIPLMASLVGLVVLLVASIALSFIAH